MREIRLSGAVTIEETCSWLGQPDEAVTFYVTRDSHFSLFAEGVAIAKLREVALAGTCIDVKTTFEVSLPGQGSDPRTDLGVLSGLFGLALAQQASNIRDAGGKDVRASLWEMLWEAVQQGHGRLGDGKKQNIVSRDPDAPIPEILLRSDRTTFPYPEQFYKPLAQVAQNLGGGNSFGSSLTERDAITFLYETARNSFDHARFDLTHFPVSGVRGILVEKLIFQKQEEIEAREQVPPVLVPHLKDGWFESRQHVYIAYTVCDLGPGIHNTLPPLQNEDQWNRLNRAFRMGESCKPTGGDIDRGLGLPNIVAAANRLKAFLFVSSANLLGYMDFHQKDSSGDGLSLDRWPTPGSGSLGTSLSLVWPSPTTTPDQGKLFG